MKKLMIIITILFLSILTLYAGQMNIHFQDGSIESFVLSDIDNITFGTSTTGELLFFKEVDGVRQIFITDVNHSYENQLTTGDFYSVDASFSPDGTKIVYVHEGTDGEGDIWIMDSNGDNKYQVTNSNINDALNPEFNNDGTKVLYQDNISTSENIIYITNIDGSNNTLLIDHPNDKDTDPFMNPVNGNQVAYLFDDGNWTPDRQIYLRDLTTGIDTLILDDNNLADYRLIISPDGNYIYWIECDYSHTGNYDLKRIKISDLTIDMIVETPDGSEVFQCRFSPDGQYIFYSISNNSGTAFYRAYPDGSNQEELFSTTDNTYRFCDIK